jgi:hypothetical protein
MQLLAMNESGGGIEQEQLTLIIIDNTKGKGKRALTRSLFIAYQLCGFPSQLTLRIFSVAFCLHLSSDTNSC